MKYETIDVRRMQGNFYSGLKEKAAKIKVGEGLEIIQSFEPIPLYEPMEMMGFKYRTEKISDNEYHIYFDRLENRQDDGSFHFRPAAITNFPIIDEGLGTIAVNFWNLTWNDEKRFLSYEMRLLLSLTNAVGAGRMRQATRELVKAYIHGLDSKALDDVFELLAWNQGIGFFSSEIGPSPLFQAYNLIKKQEDKGIAREDIANMLKEKFGEKNPEVKIK